MYFFKNISWILQSGFFVTPLHRYFPLYWDLVVCSLEMLRHLKSQKGDISMLFPLLHTNFWGFNSFSIHIFVRSISVGWIGSGIGALKSCFWEVCGVHQWYLKAILGLQESEYAICTNPMSTGLQKHLAFSWGKHIAYLCNMQQNRSVLNLIITA